MRKVLAVLLTAMMILAGCGRTDGPDDGKMLVMTSFYPLYDLTVKIGGEHVRVQSMIPAGVDPHDWTYRSQDIVNMTKAKLFIYNGAGFDDWWVDEMLGSLGARKPMTAVASAGIELIKVRGTDEHQEKEDAAHRSGHASDDRREAVHESDDVRRAGAANEHEHQTEDESAAEREKAGHDTDHDAGLNEGHAHESTHRHGDTDPHVWLSPLSAIRMAENIKAALIAADPEHEAVYAANYAKLKLELERLHAEYEAVVREAARREFVASHRAFAYLARDYGLTQLSVMGLTTESEPTSQDMKRIAQYIEEHNVKYILFEELASPEIAKTLANDLGIELLPFHPIEGLTRQQQADGEDYLSLMRHNLRSLRLALAP